MGVTGSLGEPLSGNSGSSPVDPLLGGHLPPSRRPTLDLSQFSDFESVAVGIEHAMTRALGSPALTLPKEARIASAGPPSGDHSYSPASVRHCPGFDQVNDTRVLPRSGPVSTSPRHPTLLLSAACHPWP